MSPKLLFGGDYNPEQWPREVWDEDAQLMQRAGVNTVTLGVFSWALLEPREGVFEFGWLDDVVANLSAGGIGVILATPTASPPPWFSLAHPDALPVDADGMRQWHGSRDTYCPSAPAYRQASQRIARELATRYGGHASLEAWHVHNEYGTLCWCDHAAAAFRVWLERRYGTLDALNAAWYTSFWSQRYSAWEEILPPRTTQYRHNPTQSVDFRRFSSDELLDCFREQRAEIRAAGSAAPVTTNFMLPSWNHLEQWSWSDEQDIVSIDHYLDDEGPDGEAFVAYGSDLARSWAGRDPWLLMEQSPNNIPLVGRRALKEPGRFTRNSLSYIARGSQGALFFQWRAPAAGAEAWNGGLITHAGANTAVFREGCELGEILGKIAEVAQPPATGPVLDADVAILWHADGWWALEHQSLPSNRVDYSAAVRAAHRALWHGGFATDFARPGTSLSGYKIVLVPAMFTLADDAVAALEEFVAGGGTLAVWYLSGYANDDLHVVVGGYPGRIRELLGVRVDELHALDEDERVELSDGSVADLWTEQVNLTGAGSVADYATGPLAGRPAITRAQRGEGLAYYVSTRLDEAALTRFVGDLCAEAGVTPVTGTTPPPGVEVVRRRGKSNDYLFVLNHGAEAVRVAGHGHDLVGDATTAPGLIVPAGKVAVIRETSDSSRPWTIERET